MTLPCGAPNLWSERALKTKYKHGYIYSAFKIIWSVSWGKPFRYLDASYHKHSSCQWGCRYGGTCQPAQIWSCHPVGLFSCWLWLAGTPGCLNEICSLVVTASVAKVVRHLLAPYLGSAGPVLQGHHQDAPVPASRKFNPMTKWMKIDKTG